MVQTHPSMLFIQELCLLLWKSDEDSIIGFSLLDHAHDADFSLQEVVRKLVSHVLKEVCLKEVV